MDQTTRSVAFALAVLALTAAPVTADDPLPPDTPCVELYTDPPTVVVDPECLPEVPPSDPPHP